MNFFDQLMQPVGRDHCMLFYYLGVISVVFALFAFVSLLVSLFKSKGKMDVGSVSLVFSILSNLVMYYFARVHYSICLAALQN